MGRQLVDGIRLYCPDSRETEFAMMKVEEAVLWAKAAVERREWESEEPS